MEWLDRLMEKWNHFVDKLRPGFAAVGNVFRRIGKVFATLGKYVYNLRSIILAAPVAAAAFILASINMKELPETVEITAMNIDTGSPDALFGFLVLNPEYITREMAVLGPLVVTVICLFFMLCSKRTLYPFVIALFSLCLPLVLLVFNSYPI